MEFRLRIEMENEAMRRASQVAWGLREVAAKLLAGRTEGKIMDVNGNSVGEWEIAKDANPGKLKVTEWRAHGPGLYRFGFSLPDGSGAWAMVDARYGEEGRITQGNLPSRAIADEALRLALATLENS